jgi:D-beta-D-heptose 7-phosphate kinase/D-beta-D-heptose 1-phosphate adenosyltransferase
MLRVDTEPRIRSWDGYSQHPLTEYDAIIISDYNKGFLTYENIEHIINTASCPIFIDTKKDNLTTFGRKDVYIKINEFEFNNLLSYTGNLIVTLGERGAMLGTKEFPTMPVEWMFAGVGIPSWQHCLSNTYIQKT